MKLIWILVAIAALFTAPNGGWAQSPKAVPKIGDEYELSKSYETANRTDDGSSSGSSRGRDAILERIIGISEAGLEVEYDLPKDTTPEDRASHWQFPARVLMPPNGPIRLLNQEELEARVDPWLKAADWTRAVCGKTIFTWNAFRIECNPQSVIETIKAFDLLSDDIREGAPYQDTLSRDAAIIVQERDGKTFAVVLKVDADAVRRARAKSDVIVGEILAQPVTFEEALSKRSDEEISGTVSVTFDADSVGNTWRRTKVTKLTTKRMDGRSEDYISTDIVERRLIH